MIGVVSRVEEERQTDLPAVVDAPDSVRLLLRPRHARQQQRRKNRDDGDDNQQLNQCKGFWPKPSIGASISELLGHWGLHTCSRFARNHITSKSQNATLLFLFHW